MNIRLIQPHGRSAINNRAHLVHHSQNHHKLREEVSNLERIPQVIGSVSGKASLQLLHQVALRTVSMKAGLVANCELFSAHLGRSMLAMLTS